MDRSSAKNLIKSKATEYLQPAKKKNTYICPLCKNGTGDTGDGLVTKDGIHFKCFKCDFYGDIIDLIGADMGLEPRLAFEEAYKFFKIPVDTKKTVFNYNSYYQECKKSLIKSIEAQNYLKKRGISLETAQNFNLGYDSNWRSPKALREGKNPPISKRIIIPTNSESYTARDINPEGDKVYKAIKEGSSGLFNYDALYNKESKPVFITEGEFDALSVVEVGGKAVALGSISNWKKLIENLKNNPTTAIIILALDNDDAGRKTTTQLAAEMEKLKIYYIIKNISGKTKDPNEYLVKDRKDFIIAVQKAEYEAIDKQKNLEKLKYETYIKKNSITSQIDSFIEQINHATDNPPIKTNFYILDLLLDDGLHSGLYILGAIASLGKTTFLLQICDQIALSGQDVLIFSLEMAKKELMAKSISRLTFLECNGKQINAKTTMGILSGRMYKNYNAEEKDLIFNAIKSYSTFTDHLFIYEGMGDIGIKEVRKTIENHINVTGNKPVIFIDYLQILAPYDVRSTDKQNTDKAVFELKRMSRDFDIPIIAVSSLNRDNYTSVISLKAFKESGAIEYSSDVLLGLQFEQMGQQETIKDELINQWKRQDPRKVELKILKNRNGQTGDSIKYDYYPKFNYFHEKKLSIDQQNREKR